MLTNNADGRRFRAKLLSYEQNTDDPILTPNALKLFGGTLLSNPGLYSSLTSIFDVAEAYKAGPETHLEVSPLLAESFAGLPPAYVQVAGADPLRDEGMCYSQCL